MWCRNEATGTEVVGGAVELTIPREGEARWKIGGTGGLNMVRGEGDDGSAGGRLVLVVGGGGDTDELVVTEPREFRVEPDGTVHLTLKEYVQASAALPAIGTKLGEFEARIAALEEEVSRSSEHPLPPASNQMPETGTYDPYAPGLNLCGEKE